MALSRTCPHCGRVFADLNMWVYGACSAGCARKLRLQEAATMPADSDSDDPARFGECGDCPECGSLSPWRCGCEVKDAEE